MVKVNNNQNKNEIVQEIQRIDEGDEELEELDDIVQTLAEANAAAKVIIDEANASAKMIIAEAEKISKQLVKSPKKDKSYKYIVMANEIRESGKKYIKGEGYDGKNVSSFLKSGIISKKI